MRTLTILVVLAVLVGVVTAVVAMVFRVDTGTWNLVATLSALALFALALGGATNLYLRGRAKLEEARALGTAADARRIHGIPRPAPTYNTTVNMIVMKHPDTGEVRYLPPADPVRAGSLMRQYAMQGYELDLEPR
jgi:hypothetical protein